MAASNEMNVYERLKNSLKRCRQKEPWFGYFPPIGIDDYERLSQRCRNINKCIRELCNHAQITNDEFKNYLQTDAQATTTPGEKRLILLLAKLNKDLARNEFDYLVGISKEKDFIERLENHS
ncbi:hypothetical protein I4U23_004456 [Adineta vaga]|nr:hypothetical protein I4U23_004456 [Adineta vaga]